MSGHRRKQSLFNALGVAVLCAALLPVGTPATAAEIPAPQQLPGEHSTLTTNDGSIRDDELARYVCDQIPKDAQGNPQVKDVKIMFNSCYGGGMLDDFEKVFGPGGPCEGVKWVGAAASSPGQPAYGPSDNYVNWAEGQNPGSNLGSFWTNALDDEIRNDGNVQQSFHNARDNDVVGPNGANHLEDPVVASGNGGDTIGWNEPGTNHSAVVFGGLNNRQRHDNNIENVSDALSDLWGSSLTYMGYGWGDGTTGTTAHLKGLISAAASYLDANTQLVLYFDDHGDTDFDLDEFLNWLMPYMISNQESMTFDLHPGWEEGFLGMVDQGELPHPTLNLTLLEPGILGWQWLVLLNGELLPMPSAQVAGELVLPVDWMTLHTGPNTLEVIHLLPDGPPMILENLELGSGPINEIEPVDLDGDGMPTDWEIQYPCLDPLTPDGDGDPDGDGIPSLQEFYNGTDPCPDTGAGLEYGDAPEGALAYPTTGVLGAFPTCKNVALASYVEHNNFGAWFGPSYDMEIEGNAGVCPLFTPNSYDQDECFQDGDAGLLMPEAYTITGPVGAEQEVPCPRFNGTPLGTACQTAIWGTDIDIHVHNTMPSATPGHVNLLVDWNGDGRWGGFVTCPGGIQVPEHVLVNFVVPNPYDGPLSALMAANTGFVIGPNPGYAWARFSITERPVPLPWVGEGTFEDGESEDYLLRIDAPPVQLDFGDAPDSSAAPGYPTLLASSGARHVIVPGYHLGTASNSLDAEPDGQPDATATGDDNDGNDDEDGVTFMTTPLIPGQQAIVDITNSMGLGGTGFLDGWIDFNGDGDWSDAGEQVFTSFALSPLGFNSVFVPIPATATPNITTAARFRFSSTGGLAVTGLAQDGEVEDYMVPIGEALDIKWIQPPHPDALGYHAHDSTGSQLHVADDWRCLGGLVWDLHWWGNYEVPTGPMRAFRLSIYGDLGGQPDLGSGPLWTTDATLGPAVGQVQETPWAVAITGEQIYEYRYDFSTPFPQVQGQVYWLDIMALSLSPQTPVKWRWQSNYDAMVLNAPMQWDALTGFQGTLNRNMAFIITSGPDVDEPGVTVTKTLLIPQTGHAVVSDTVRFEIVVTNSGNTTLGTVPLYDYYSPACLENPVVSPMADGSATNAGLGILHWSDLTGAGSLAPGSAVTVTLDFHATITDTMYWKEGGWLDYAPKGMPDFDQRQDQWDSPPGSGQKWYYCGPVAAANSLWWFDSKFEPNPQTPPVVSDGYPLVQAPAGAAYDDHDPANVQPLANTLAGLMGTQPFTGTRVSKLAAGIQQQLANAGLSNQYTITSQPKPLFSWVEHEVRRSEDVILLMGYWQPVPGTTSYVRVGGHYVTVAGIDSEHLKIAFSDPTRDRAEGGGAGRVLPNPHLGLHPGVPTGTTHNDAKYASHDVYTAGPTPSPGGAWGLPGYTQSCTEIENWVGQNEGDFSNQGDCNPTLPIFTEVEYAVAVSPITPTVTCDPTTNIAVVSGAVDLAGNEAPEAQAHARVRIKPRSDLDFGDAPDPTYPTFLASNGARHIKGSLWMGQYIDTEPDGQPVDQDDTMPLGGPDDEDGVTLLGAGPVGGPYAMPYLAGRNGAVAITVSGAGNGFLHGWFDWNQDGDWADAGENVFGGFAVAANASYMIDFPVPAGALPGRTWARFRLDDQNLNAVVGLARNGEVEDYPATVQRPAGPSVSVTKAFLHPTNRTTLLVGEQVSFEVQVQNTGTTTMTYVPLTDRFDQACLTYLSKTAVPPENTFDGISTIDWFDLRLAFGRDLAPGQTFTITIPFSVTGVSANGYNTAEVAGAHDLFNQVAAPVSDTVTFSCVRPASIGDRVWHDLDRDGIQDLREPGVGGVQVDLYDAAGSWVISTTTDISGTYRFDNLVPGGYYLEFQRPSGYSFTLKDVDDGNPNPDLRDSDADPTTGRTATTTLTAGENDMSWDAGVVAFGSISGLVWHDLNGSMVVDAGEPGLGGVVVYATGGSPSPPTGSSKVQQRVPLAVSAVYSATTAANGTYSMTGLPPGTYVLTVDATTLPAGMMLTTGNLPMTVTLAAGQNLTAIRFGYALPVTVGDYIFLDKPPATGTPGPEDDVGINMVMVVMTDTVRNLMYTQVSAGTGAYQFGGLLPSTYTIAVIVPPGMVLTTAQPQTFTILSGQSDLSRDFGFTVTTAVSLQSFSARRVGNRTVVTWATHFEGDNQGFHLWRADSASGSYQRLTSQPIVSTAPAGSGAVYRYIDRTAQAGRTYWYRLEAVPSGERFGPVSDNGAAARQRLFMPVLLREG